MTTNSDPSNYGVKRTHEVYKLIGHVSRSLVLGRKSQGTKVLIEGLYDLGGVYIKFLQLLITLVPDFAGLNDDMRSKIFDKVSAPKLDINQILVDEFGYDYDKYLTNVSSEPVAAGSFASAYSATHADGTPVIIKVLRPNLSKQLKTDMRLLGIVAKTSQPLFRSDLINLKRMYNEFKTTVWQEIDYPAEARNAANLSDMYQNDDKLIIPRTYPDLLTKNVLVQERIFGIPLSDLLAKGLKGEEAKQFVQNQLGSDLISQLEVLGSRLIFASLAGPHLHGDPHPGNVFLLPNDKIALIDFGVSLKKITMPKTMFEIIKSEHSYHVDVDSVDFPEHATRLFKLYNAPVFKAVEILSKEIKDRGGDLDLLREIRNVIEKIVEPSLPKLREFVQKDGGVPTRILLEAANHDNQFALQTNEQIARITRTLSLFWSTTRRLGIKKEVGNRVFPVVDKMLIDSNIELEDLSGTPTYGQALEILNDWMAEMVQRNPLMFGGLFATIRQKLHYKDALPQGENLKNA